MDKRVKKSTASTGPPLPLSSLRLLVSPLRLMYSFVWHVVNQRNVMHYGKVEEFVTVVTEAVPKLLSYKQRAQLILGLRARMILELFRKDPPNLLDIQRLLEKMNILGVRIFLLCDSVKNIFRNDCQYH
uniref:TERF1-interacting nuclear factor 2 N-terminal domain-containing protein n=1 Tax=Hucho hucho TaxID=62062 RepID=A0A4W5JUV5_9TELE